MRPKSEPNERWHYLLGAGPSRWLKVVVAFDGEADVLYLSAGDPSDAVAFDESPEGHALRFDADGRLVGITVVGARRIAEQGRDVRVQAPVTLSAETLASIVR